MDITQQYNVSGHQPPPPSMPIAPPSYTPAVPPPAYIEACGPGTIPPPSHADYCVPLQPPPTRFVNSFDGPMPPPGHVVPGVPMNQESFGCYPMPPPSHVQPGVPVYQGQYCAGQSPYPQHAAPEMALEASDGYHTAEKNPLQNDGNTTNDNSLQGFSSCVITQRDYNQPTSSVNDELAAV